MTAAVALEESTLENIAEVQHRDRFGNVISESCYHYSIAHRLTAILVDPDRSNPTRPRLERPLDTIRAFERAAEATHSGRRSTYSGRPGSQVGYDPSQSRRSSYFGGTSESISQGHENVLIIHAGNSNVGNYNQQYRSRPGVRQSYYAGNGWQRPESVAEHGAGPTYNNNRAMMMRNGMNGGYGHNPDNSISSAGNSFDPSGSEGMANGSTQPSSQNSSIEHFQQRKFDDHPYQSQNNHYSPNGDYSPVSPQYSQNDLQNYSADDPYNRNANLSNGNMNGYNSHNNPSPTRAPAPPSKVGPIKLGNSSAQEISQDSYLSLKQAPSQRKSWFKRRFSKQKEEF